MEDGALDSLASAAHGEVVLETGLSYTPEHAVSVRIRKRDQRYDLDDDGTAVRLAGEPPGWWGIAEGLMTAHGLNVNRRGVVFVPAVVGRDVRALALSVADTSRTLYLALIESDVEVGFDSDTSVE